MNTKIIQWNCSTLSSLLGEAQCMPIGYYGSCLVDHNRCESMVETPVVSCKSWLHVTCVQSIVGEIAIVITCMEWCVTGLFTSASASSPSTLLGISQEFSPLYIFTIVKPSK